MSALEELLMKNWELIKFCVTYRRGGDRHLPAIEALSEQVVTTSRACHGNSISWRPLLEVLENYHNGFYVELKQAIDEKSKFHNQHRRFARQERLRRYADRLKRFDAYIAQQSLVRKQQIALVALRKQQKDDDFHQEILRKQWELARKKREMIRKEQALMQMELSKKRKMKRLRKQKKQEKRQRRQEDKERRLQPPKVFKSGLKGKTSRWVWFALLCAVVHIGTRSR